MSALKTKLSRLEHELEELRAAKLHVANQLRSAVASIESVTRQNTQTIYLRNSNCTYPVQGHIARHEASCKLLERKFEESKGKMLKNLGLVKEIKLMLGAHQNKRAAASAASLSHEVASAEGV